VARNWELASKKGTAPLCHLLPPQNKKKHPRKLNAVKKRFFMWRRATKCVKSEAVVSADGLIQVDGVFLRK
jgi:hypothetical protein